MSSQDGPEQAGLRQAPLTINARASKHREGLRGEQCARVDVWIGADWVDGARTIAKWQQRPLWAVIQDAIKAYVSLNARINTPLKDRVAGNERRDAPCTSP